MTTRPQKPETDGATEVVNSLFTQRPISHEEAQEIAKRFIDGFFHNEGEHPRCGIPARPDYDDDLLILAYIEQQAKLQSENARLREQVKELREGLKPFADAADGWHDGVVDDRSIITWPAEEEYDGEQGGEFTLADLRRARDLMEKTND